MQVLKRRPPPPRNPFVAIPAAPATDPGTTERDALFGEPIVLAGPPRPLRTATRPGDLDRLPSRRLTGSPLLWVVGLHGGAGATWTAGLLGEEVREAGQCWPLPPRRPAKGTAQPEGTPPPQLCSPVLLVTRTHAAGLDAAAAAARTWSSGHLGDLPLLGLVLVDDAPRASASLRATSARVARMVPHSWHLPWRESWRELTHPPAEGLPFRVRRTVTDIRSRATRTHVLAQEGTAQ